jgi:hypothetical protein
VPLMYDSIQGTLKDIVIEQDKGKMNSFHYVIKPSYEVSQLNKHPHPFIQRHASEIVVFKNGKAGLITTDHDILLAAEYDMIVHNFIGCEESYVRDFMILKKDGFYGVASSSYNYKENKYVFNKLVEPVLKNIPLYYIPDYYGKKDFRLYALFDEHYNFKGYANWSGLLYYKD